MNHRPSTREQLYRFFSEPTSQDPGPGASRSSVEREWLGVLDRGGSTTRDRHALAEAALEAALHFSAAPRGNMQLADANGVLHIEAQHGFEAPFLAFFEAVHAGQAACGAAQESGAVIIVEDVRTSPLFVNTPALDVMRAAHVLAVVSFPIIRRSGDVAGVLSVHYEGCGRPSRHALGMVGSIAERLGRLL